MATDCANCSVVMPHLNQLAEEYGRDEMILVELIPWGLYAIPEAKQRRAWYSVDFVPIYLKKKDAYPMNF